MEDLKMAMNEHMDLMADLVQKFTAELRTGFQPAYDNFIGFFHAIDWKVVHRSLSIYLGFFDSRENAGKLIFFFFFFFVMLF